MFTGQVHGPPQDIKSCDPDKPVAVHFTQAVHNHKYDIQITILEYKGWGQMDPHSANADVPGHQRGKTKRKQLTPKEMIPTAYQVQILTHTHHLKIIYIHFNGSSPLGCTHTGMKQNQIEICTPLHREIPKFHNRCWNDW